MRITVTVTLDIQVELVSDEWGEGFIVPERSPEEVRAIEDEAGRQLAQVRNELEEDNRADAAE